MNPFQAPSVPDVVESRRGYHARKAQEWFETTWITTVCAALFLMICMIMDVTCGLPVMYAFLLLGMSIPLGISIIVWQYHCHK